MMLRVLSLNAFAATQILAMINFNFVMKAMPALPIDWQADR